MTESESKLFGVEFIGIVEDNVDPDKKQRIKVRIPYLHGTKDLIPTEALPWSQPYRDNSGISYSVPEINKIVNITFPTGNPYYPVYKNAQHLNVNLQKKIEEYDGDDYASFVALCYNYNTQMYFDKENFELYYKKSGLKIKEDWMTLMLANPNTELRMGNDSAAQAAMLGNNFFDWFDTFMQALQNGFIGNSGAPVIPNGTMIDVLLKYNTLKKDFLSKRVFIVDNNNKDKNEIELTAQTGDKSTVTISNNKALTSVAEEAKLTQPTTPVVTEDENIKKDTYIVQEPEKTIEHEVPDDILEAGTETDVDIDQTEIDKKLKENVQTTVDVKQTAALPTPEPEVANATDVAGNEEDDASFFDAPIDDGGDVYGEEYYGDEDLLFGGKEVEDEVIDINLATEGTQVTKVIKLNNVNIKVTGSGRGIKKYGSKYQNTVFTGYSFPDEPITIHKVKLNKTIATLYIPTLNQIAENKGAKLLATAMTIKEGFQPGTRSYRTNNPGNIGNTDNGKNSSYKSLKEGIMAQIKFLKAVAGGSKNNFEFGKKTLKIYYSKEMDNNPDTYKKSPILPGYQFTFNGELGAFVKIYSTGARGGNGYLKLIISYFAQNGITITEHTKIQDIIKIK